MGVIPQTGVSSCLQSFVGGSGVLLVEIAAVQHGPNKGTYPTVAGADLLPGLLQLLAQGDDGVLILLTQAQCGGDAGSCRHVLVFELLALESETPLVICNAIMRL